MSDKSIFFSDSSFDPGSKSGVAGFIVVQDSDVAATQAQPPSVQTSIFHGTTCSRLEIESVLIVLHKIREMSLAGQAVVYTDCKTVVELPGRRTRLEFNGYIGKSSGKTLSNADLYKSFFILIDELSPVFIWIKGHRETRLKHSFDNLFSIVDKATRKELRNIIG